MPATPQYSWPLINQRLGADAWIKHENNTPVGAFKLRGALVYATWLKETKPDLEGVVAATRGNFGQGAATAARLLGLKSVIVVPHAPRTKLLANAAVGRCKRRRVPTLRVHAASNFIDRNSVSLQTVSASLL